TSPALTTPLQHRFSSWALLGSGNPYRNMVLLVILGIYVGLALLGWLFENAKKIRENRASILTRKEYELNRQAEKLAFEKSALARYTTDAKASIQGLAKQKA